jgi:hypothetical protein
MDPYFAVNVIKRNTRVKIHIVREKTEVLVQLYNLHKHHSFL